jgi:hypothetical protein
MSIMAEAVVTIVTTYFNDQNPCFLPQTACVSYTVILTVSSDIFCKQHLVFIIETMGVYCEAMKVMSACLSNETTLLLLYRFSCNYILVSFTKIGQI